MDKIERLENLLSDLKELNQIGLECERCDRVLKLFEEELVNIIFVYGLIDKYKMD